MRPSRLVLAALTLSLAAAAQTTSAPLKGPVTFTCGPANKSTPLTATTIESESAAGWDLSTAPSVANGICSSEKPFFFSIPVPEGNYRVTVTLGGKQDSDSTIRAEARRLMIEKLPVAANKSVTRSFDVNVRVPEFTKPIVVRPERK